MSTIVNFVCSIFFLKEFFFVCSMIIYLFQFTVATNFERKQISFSFFITEYYPCVIDDHCPREMCLPLQIPRCVAGLCKCFSRRWERH